MSRTYFHGSKTIRAIEVLLNSFKIKAKFLSTCPAKNQAGCIERVVHHSHENQKFYLFKVAINEKCQKPKLKVKAVTVAMATAV